MKLLIALMILSCKSFAMGDPNFIPANPVVGKEVKGMVDTNRTLNQIDQKKNRQEQEAPKLKTTTKKKHHE